MRHRSGLRKLNITDGAHRQAMLRNISNSLVQRERIKTTLPRAKELRRFLEPLITRGKTPSLANRRLVFSRLRDRESVSKIFDDLAPRCAERPGGYLRILKHGFRVGDNAAMALVEFVDRREEPAPVAADEKKEAKKEVKAAGENAEGAESTEEVEKDSTEDSTEDSSSGEDSAEEEKPAS